jgi:hypothetical protein
LEGSGSDLGARWVVRTPNVGTASGFASHVAEDTDVSAFDVAEPEDRSVVARGKVTVRGLVVGGEQDFIFSWSRAEAALKSKAWQLGLSMLLNVALLVLVGYLVWSAGQAEPLVFVRDSLGNVVQADPDSFLHAGDVRSSEEVKAFIRKWVVDAYSWTPLDVEDRVKASLRLVDGKAQPLARAGMRLAERSRQVEQGLSGGIYDQGTPGGKEPQAVIMQADPLEVMVSVERYLVDKTGVVTPAGPLFVRALLREVPRSPSNGNGLMIVDLRISEKL